MIPLKLHVKNFMCYRDGVPALDLEGIHVACLCGDNGHGKSALLDAVTWALWGKSRAGTQDELVHQGLEDMAVDLEFSARSQRYRVSRKYARRGKQGHTILELQLSSDNGFTPISDNSVRETEKRIVQILHMEYETFVNTAFLLQGRADMFTAAKPAERKRILAETLDLAYYETLEERAKGRGKRVQEKIQSADSRIEIRKQEAARRPDHEKALEAVSAGLEDLESRRRQAQALHRELHGSVTALRARASELEELQRRTTSAQTEIADLDSRVAGHLKGVADAEALIAREPEIQQGFESLSRVRLEVERLQDAAFAAARLEQEAARLNEAIAVERARLTGDSQRVRSRIARDLEPKANRREEIESELADIAEERKALAGLESDVKRQRAATRELGEKLDALNRALETRREIEARKAGVEREVAVLRTQLEGQVDRQARRVAELKQAAAAFGPTERQLEDLDGLESKLAADSEELDASRRERESMDSRMAYIRQANEDLRAQMQDARRNFDILDEDEARCPICKHPLGPDGKQHLKAEYEAQGKDQKRRYSENSADIKKLETNRSRLSAQISQQDKNLAERVRRAARQRADLESRLHDAGKAREELVTAEAWRVELESNLRAGSFAHDEKTEIRLIDEELAGVEYDPDLRRAIERRLADAREEVEALQDQLAQRRAAAAAGKAVLDAELEAANQAAQELPTRRKELEELDRIISTGAFAQEERAGLRTLRAEMDHLGYDAQEHRAAQDKAKELAHYDDSARNLSDAKTRLPRYREDLRADTQMLARRRSELEADLERCDALRADVDSIPARERELADAERSRDSLEDQVRRAAVEKERLLQELERLDRLEAETRQLEAERKGLADEKSIYDELAVAFGRNGIQALMIERAIPQLQDEANEILGRLTENRMFLKLQVLEGRRSRGVRSEELAISISDEVGTRSYEMFSGGEAFRINFALRIALSKLLARRSGAPLPILFIDEGFGSLDANGQEHLKEAIQSVQSDFEKIIVITHVEQVKEAFPVRIEVTKTPAGSTFAVA